MGKLALGSIAAAGFIAALAGTALAQVDPGELAAFDNMRPDPGMYRNESELVRFDAPGLDPNMRGMVSQMMARGYQRDNTHCITPEESGEEWLESLANSDCTLDSLTASGNSFATAMTCTVEGGQTASIAMTGTASGNNADLTMTISTQIPDMGRLTMTMRTTSTRIGDC